MLAKRLIYGVLGLLMLQACGSDTTSTYRSQAGQAIHSDVIVEPTKPETPAPSVEENFDAEFMELLRTAEAEVGSDDTIPISIDLPGTGILEGIAKLLENLGDRINLDISAIMDKIKEIFPNLDNLDSIGGLDGINKVIVVYALSSMAAEDQGHYDSYLHGDASYIDIGTILLIARAVITIIELFTKPDSTLGDLLDMLRNGSLDKLIEIIKGWLGGSANAFAHSGYAMNPLEKLPDFSEILGLDDLKDFEELKSRFKAHVKHVLDNFDGPIKDALISMLKLGYGQAYQGMKS